MLLYVVAIGISHSILIPGHKKINALLAEMESVAGARGRSAAASRRDPGDRQAHGRGRRATLNVFVVIFLYLMIWKPGV